MATGLPVEIVELYQRLDSLADLAMNAIPLVSFGKVPYGVLVLIVALAIVEVALDIVALVDLYRRPADQVSGNKWLWVALVLLVNLLGPILYLTVGRKPMAAVDDPTRLVPQSRRTEEIVDALYGPRDDPGQN